MSNTTVKEVISGIEEEVKRLESLVELDSDDIKSLPRMKNDLVKINPAKHRIEYRTLVNRLDRLIDKAERKRNPRS